MKRSLILLAAYFMACALPLPEVEIIHETEKLLLNKWLPYQYVIDEKAFPVELTRGEDYIEFKPNHQKHERFHGEDVKGNWEYLPHGNFIMLYGPKKKIYVPARILSISDEWLKIETFDVRSGKMVITIYKAKK